MSPLSPLPAGHALGPLALFSWNVSFASRTHQLSPSLGFPGEFLKGFSSLRDGAFSSITAYCLLWVFNSEVMFSI